MIMSDCECPICFDAISEENKVILCNNNHYVCKTCIELLIKNKTDNCHTCRTKIKSSIIKHKTYENIERSVGSFGLPFGRTVTMSISRDGNLYSPTYLKLNLPEINFEK
jgi:hypothetical protein